MYRIFLFLCSLLIIPNLYGQITNFNITRLDSSEHFYSKIQGEIKNKSIGTFRDTIFADNYIIYQIISYRNFEAPDDSKSIWTIVDKYEYRPFGKVEKIEHWKTDNQGNICKCGSWQLQRKGIWVAIKPYPRCAKKSFRCNSAGDPIR